MCGGKLESLIAPRSERILFPINAGNRCATDAASTVFDTRNAGGAREVATDTTPRSSFRSDRGAISDLNFVHHATGLVPLSFTLQKHIPAAPDGFQDASIRCVVTQLLPQPSHVHIDRARVDPLGVQAPHSSQQLIA